MFTTRLIVLALPLTALVIACSDTPESSRSAKDGPTIVPGEDSDTSESAASTPSSPSAGTTSAPQDTKQTADGGPETPKGDAGGGNNGGGNNGGGGGDNGGGADCAVLEGQACFQCCLENGGDENNDFVNCLNNCAP